MGREVGSAGIRAAASPPGSRELGCGTNPGAKREASDSAEVTQSQEHGPGFPPWIVLPPEEHRGFNILSTAQHGKRTERFAFSTDAALAMGSQLPLPPEPSPALRKQAQMSLPNILMSRYILHS